MKANILNVPNREAYSLVSDDSRPERHIGRIIDNSVIEKKKT